jgi:hypothetical protein
VQSTAATVEDYLAELPEERRAAVAAVRDAVNASLPPGYDERMQHGMISWVVPRERYPDTPNGQPLVLASLASQKRHMALYLMCTYSEEAKVAFRARWKATGRKLDMGKSCVRFRRLEDVALDVVAEEIAASPVERMIDAHDRAHR